MAGEVRRGGVRPPAAPRAREKRGGELKARVTGESRPEAVLIWRDPRGTVGS